MNSVAGANPSAIKAEQLRRLQTERMRFYEPHSQQLAFHKSKAAIRAIITGNQWGKTYAGAVEALWILGKVHPYKENLTGPVYGRACGINFDTMNKAMVQHIKHLAIRKPCIINGRQWPGLRGGSWDSAFLWNNNEKALFLEDGSFLEFRSYDQDLGAYAGSQRHFIWMDEEPSIPGIWGENVMRQTIYKPCIYLTMTPLNYSEWLFDQIMRQPPGRVDMFSGSTADNPYANPETIALAEGTIQDEAERNARLHGKWVVLEGRVWKEYGEHNYVPAPAIDSSWDRTLVLDPHDEKASYVAWFARDPRTRKDYQYREANLSGSFEEISNQIKILSMGDRINVYLMDKKSGDQKSTLRGSGSKLEEFGRYLPFAAARPCDSVSQDCVRRAIVNNPTGGPMAFVTQDCPIAHRQMLSYSWKKPLRTGEDRNKPEISRRNDEAPACWQYYMTYVGVGDEVAGYNHQFDVGQFAYGG